MSFNPFGSGSRVLIVGGAGFVGSHFTDHLLAAGVDAVTLYDNFSSGREWHYAHHDGDSRLQVVRADVRELDRLAEVAANHRVIIHLASNPDIAAAVSDPDIDFRQGTDLTRCVAEAARRGNVDLVLYASGSGVYGELGEVEAHEAYGPMMPVSTYGASKLAGETLLCSYSHMFGFKTRAFRFGNVVGPRQTHGVGFDFVRKLRADPERLEILGDGRQSKSYIHIDDILAAVSTAALQAMAPDAEPFNVFNVATGDYITVTEIAGLAVRCLGLSADEVELAYTGGDRGWKGDVPIVRLSTDRIQTLGWTCARSSEQALSAALEALLQDFTAGRMEA